MGDKYLKELDYENAEIAYKKAIEIDDKRENGYVKLAIMYVETKDYDRAYGVIELGLQEAEKDEVLKEIEAKLDKEVGKAEETDGKEPASVPTSEPELRSIP